MFPQNCLKFLESVKMSTLEYLQLKIKRQLNKYKLTDFEKNTIK